MSGDQGPTAASTSQLPGPSQAGRISNPPSSGRTAWVVAVVVVVAIVLVAGLWAGGFFAGPGSNPTTVVSFAAASAAASSASQGYSGGGWQLIQALGVTMHDGATLQYPSFGPSCPMSSAAGMSGGSAMFPGYSDPGTGMSPGWEMMYRNSSGGFLLVTVLNGKASIVGGASGSNCLLYPLLRAIPGSIADSTTVVAAINQAGGSAFLAAHASASSVLGVMGGMMGHAFPSPPLNATWEVVYSSCTAGAGIMATGSAFIGWANATSGTVLNTTVVSGSCTAMTSMPSMPSSVTGWTQFASRP